MKNEKNIVLIGFMGVGKSSVGRVIANNLNMDFIDTDNIIEQQQGIKIADIFAKKGELYFRQVEQEVITQISKCKNTVIATGGGVVLNHENIKQLRINGIILHLKADAETILRNTLDCNDRPLLQYGDIKKRISEMLLQREKYYLDNDYEVDVSKLSIDKVAEVIIDIINNRNE